MENDRKKKKIHKFKANSILNANRSFKENKNALLEIRRRIAAKKVPIGSVYQALDKLNVEPNRFLFNKKILSEDLNRSGMLAVNKYASQIFKSYKYSYNEKLAKVVKEYRKQIGDHDKNLRVADILMHEGWVTFEVYRSQVLKDNYDKSKKEVLDYIEHYYLDNDYKNFFEVFDAIVEEFYASNEYSDGYAKQIYSIEKLVKQNFENYKVVINTVFSIIEYVCSIKFNLILTNGFIQPKSIKDKRKEYVQKFEEGKYKASGNIHRITELSVFQVLKDTWADKHFKVGIEKTQYGRGPIQHGRYDPDRLKETDFIKLIVLLFGIMTCPNFNETDQD